MMKRTMNDSYGTPQWLMDVFDGWFDPCPLNPCPKTDGLSLEWGGRTYCNPPYSKPDPWVNKAIEESGKGKTIVMLMRVDTSTRWFARLVEVDAHFFWYSGRMKFTDPFRRESSGRANFPSMLVVLPARKAEAEG